MDATQPEQWRPVVGYEGHYEVSDHGRVRSLDRIAPYGNTTRRRRGTIRKTRPAPKGGHLMLNLTREKTIRGAYVHRLVLEAFVGPCPDGMEACHHDDDPTNNHLSNLRWDTRGANLKDRYRNGYVHPNSRKTRCIRGHELSGANLRVFPDGHRQCRECNSMY